MTAVIWKEVREQFKWAVLWMVAVGVLLALTLMPQYKAGARDIAEGLCAPACQAVTMLAAALGGYLLGLLQTVTELKPARRGFVVHRPISRTRLFVGKVAGGLILLIPALLLPLLLAAVWVNTPGQFAVPWVGRMLLPGLANVLTGIVFYFAGVLTGARSARWYASRSLGLVVAILCASSVLAAPEFWHVVLVVIVFGTVLALVAWGSFLTAGEFRPQPRGGKIALGLILLAGLGAIGVCGASILMEALKPPGWPYNYYYVDRAGRLLCVTMEAGGIVTHITDLAGHDVPEYTEFLKPERQQKLWREVLTALPLLAERTYFRDSYRASQRYFQSTGFSLEARWYFVVAEGRIFGYSQRDRRFVGSLGRDGFSTSALADGRSFGPTQTGSLYGQGSYFVEGASLYKVDFTMREVQKIYTADMGQTAESCVRFGQWLDPNTPTRLVVATSDRIDIITEAGKKLGSTPYHCDRRLYRSVDALLLPDASRHFLYYHVTANLPVYHWATLHDVIVAVAEDGTELARYDLPAVKPPPESTWRDGLIGGAIPLIGGCVAILGGVWTSLTHHESQWSFAQVRYELASSGGRAAWATGATAMVLAAILCALITAAIARRYAFTSRQRRWWTLASLFGGWAVVLTLAALYDWPARVACPSCRRKRVVTRDTCEHCGAPFAPPATDGTEIFETQGAAEGVAR